MISWKPLNWYKLLQSSSLVYGLATLLVYKGTGASWDQPPDPVFLGRDQSTIPPQAFHSSFNCQSAYRLATLLDNLCACASPTAAKINPPSHVSEQRSMQMLAIQTKCWNFRELSLCWKRDKSVLRMRIGDYPWYHRSGTIILLNSFQVSLLMSLRALCKVTSSSSFYRALFTRG